MSIVTISRLAGSGGDEIARGLAQTTGYQLLGPEDFQTLAQQHDPELGGKLKSFFNDEGHGFFERLFFSSPVYQSLYRALVFEMAARGRVIIMGRGAQIVLKDVKRALKVRVVASMDKRLLHMCSTHGLTPDEAMEYIRRHDHQRDALVRQIYDKEPDDWKFYDLIINTDRLDVVAGTQLIIEALEALERLHPANVEQEDLPAAALGKRVEAKLRAEVRGSRSLKVAGQAGGVMLLHGTVANERARAEAERLAAKQPGVTSVVNQLRHGVFAYGQ